MRSVAFYPNGQLLAIGSDDATVRFWSLADSPPSDASIRILHISGPYAGMNITGVTGISEAQQPALIVLDAADGTEG